MNWLVRGFLCHRLLQGQGLQHTEDWLVVQGIFRVVEDAGLDYFVKEIFTKEEVVEERDMGDPLSLVGAGKVNLKTVPNWVRLISLRGIASICNGLSLTALN